MIVLWWYRQKKYICMYKFCGLFLQPLRRNSYKIPQTTSSMHFFLLVVFEELNKRIFKIHKIFTSDLISKYKKYKILPYSVSTITRLPPYSQKNQNIFYVNVKLLCSTIQRFITFLNFINHFFTRGHNRKIF